MHSDTGSPQRNGIWRFTSIPEIQKKSQKDQSDPVTTKDKVQRATVCTSTHTSCTQTSSNKRTDIDFKSWWFQCNQYGIQKLKSPKNPRSIQTSTLWAGLTDTNDMPIDNSRPHRLWTHAHSRSKQTVSNTLDWYYESRKNHEPIKMTFWQPKTRYKKACGAPALIQVALHRPYTPRLVRIPPVDHLHTIYIVFKSSRIKKLGDRSKSRHFGQASQTRMTCQWTLAKHNDYGLKHRLALNKWYLDIDSGIMDPWKITKRSKWPSGHQRQGIRRHEVHQHSHKLHSTVLKQKELDRLHELAISI
jgi:hypothetical protein